MAASDHLNRHQFMTVRQVGRLPSGDYGGARMSDVHQDDYARWEMDRDNGYEPEKYDELANDVAEHGVREPLELGSRGAVMNGHHRYFAAVDAGLDKIPVSGRRMAANTVARYTPPGRH